MHKEKEDNMDIRIQAIHFDIADALTAFINKKVERLVRRYPEISVADATRNSNEQGGCTENHPSGT